MSWKFGQIQPWTAELAALDQFKNLLVEIYSKYFDDLLSGERSLPFGLLVYKYEVMQCIDFSKVAKIYCIPIFATNVVC